MHRSVRLPVFASAGAVVLASLGAASPAAAAAWPVINEFSASTTGTDVEYIELLAAPGTDLSGHRILHIEGDAPTLGVVDSILVPGTADASGRVLLSLAPNTLENGTISLLLVTGTLPTVGSDIDADNDGAIDAVGLTIVDSIAVTDGTSGDLTYGGVTLGTAYDGLPFTPGGASRIPDGVDTDTTADWLRNDFDLAGITGISGSPVFKEALNTPGAVNSAVPKPEEPAGDADCTASIVPIGSVQGSGAASPVAGSVVRIEGTVVADFQTTDLDGFYLQDAGDTDPATSNGIFVFQADADDDPGNGDGIIDVSVGDVVNVAGAVSEYQGLTEVTAAETEVCETGVALPAPAALTLPLEDSAREAVEGMSVAFSQSLTIGSTSSSVASTP